jgi:hypothetical protein
MKKTTAAILTTSILIITILLVFLVIDKPFCCKKYNNDLISIAAISIRDDVSDFEKSGSYMFTNSRLKKTYKQVLYITLDKPWYEDMGLFSEIKTFINKNDRIDIYLLAHGNDIISLFNELDSLQKEKIRIVYNTGCANAKQSYLWLAMGADSYVSHNTAKSNSPIFYFFYLRRWCNGYNLEEAVNQANAKQENIIKVLSVFGFDPLLYDSKAQIYGNLNFKINERK